MTQEYDEQGEFLESERFFTHAYTPENVGVLPNPDGFAMPKGSCGDYIELYLRIENDIITGIRFMPEGCLNTVASASAMTMLAKGKHIDEAGKQVTVDAIEEELGGLPEDHRHCAALATATLKAAIRDFKKKQA